MSLDFQRLIVRSILLFPGDKSIIGGHVRWTRNRAAVKPTIILSRKFRKGCLARNDGTRGESGRHWFRSYKSAPTRNYPPSPVSEPRFEHGFRRGMLTPIRPHGLIAFENGEKCEPGGRAVPPSPGDLGFSHLSKCKRYHRDNFVTAR